MEIDRPIRSWTSLSTSQVLHIDAADVSHAAEARRVAQSIAASLGLDETRQGEAAIIATECATNLARHGGGGQLHLRAVGEELEILAIDAGPGMTDVDRCMTDGFSSAGSAGTGLGAVRRMSSTFDIHSVPGRGTAVLSRLRAGRQSQNGHDEAFLAGGAWMPSPGELVCGDACAVATYDGSIWAFVADGLGHGVFASEAARTAVKAFESSKRSSVAARIEDVHLSLRPTRGAAIAAARIDAAERRIEYAGIGNIGGTVRRAEASTGLVSLSGIAGHQVRKIQPFSYSWIPGGFLVLHSDGLQSHWTFDGENGLALRHPSIIAAVLMRNFSRGRDDVMVVVVRERA